MYQEKTELIENKPVQGDYCLFTVRTDRIAGAVRPGQFIHVEIPNREDLVLRRPFSVYRTDDGKLSVLYKKIGKGTEMLSALQPGTALDVLGPLGNGFPAPDAGCRPLLVAGGYGMAALYLLARACAEPGVVMVGGATRRDLLCMESFTELGWEVRAATEDGSLGTKGLVTQLLDEALQEPARPPELFACGPMGMLQAVGQRAVARDCRAWLSLDRHMGCGVGACLACVQKIKTPEGEWRWARVCREGPVFECRDVWWEDAG
jgi:dihydroorotate dehydrogenase electron transfer subunit